jgi:hypothetical protein
MVLQAASTSCAPAACGRRSGSVLLIVLAGLALSAVAAAGLLLVAAREVETSRAAAEVVRVRTAAESATRAAIAAWDRAVLPAIGPALPVPLPAGQLGLPGSLQTRASAERIGSALWLVRGHALLDPGGGGPPIAEATSAAIVVSVPAPMPWSAFPAAIGSAGDVVLDPAARIDGNAAPTAPPPWGTPECPTVAAATGTALFGSPARPGILLGPGAIALGAGATVSGAPAVQPASPATDSSAMDWLGPLRFGEAAAAADRIELAVVTPGPPPVAASCDVHAPGNWGAPLDSSSPCADYFPLIHAPAGLTVGPGAGQGVLLVDGDLDLQPGAVFYGAIAVRGRLSASGATIHGGVRTLGTTGSLDIRVFASDCALWRAFERAPGLRRAWRPPGRWWLPPI